jgi:hypothetical protein
VSLSPAIVPKLDEKAANAINKRMRKVYRFQTRTIQKIAWGYGLLFPGVYSLDFVPGTIGANGKMFGVFSDGPDDELPGNLPQTIMSKMAKASIVGAGAVVQESPRHAAGRWHLGRNHQAVWVIDRATYTPPQFLSAT